MHKVWAVIRREFLERVRTKWFIISTVLGPVFMIGIAVLPSLLLTKGGEISDVVLLDVGAGRLAGQIEAQLERSGRFRIEVRTADAAAESATVEALTREVQGRGITGFLVLSDATLESGKAEYRGRNVSSIAEMSMIERVTRQAVTVERLGRRGVDPAVVQEAQQGIEVRTRRITRRGATDESGEATFFLGYGMALIMYVVTLAYGITVMRSVVQEKQDRIIELLISSLKPFELLLGKVIGVGGVGLLQMGIWGAVGLATVRYRAQVLSVFGVPAEAAQAFTLPSVGIELMLVAAVYFLLGYVLYSALFAVVGAAVNSETEAGQAQQPVMMLLVLALMLSIGALGNPTGQVARIGSLVPFSAPIVMPTRMATGDVPLSELLMSIGITLATVLAVVWVAGRIYRIGILMYGKRPSIREILRWARQS